MKFLINAFFKAKKIAAKMVDSFAASNMAQIANCHVCWCSYVRMFVYFGVFLAYLIANIYESVSLCICMCTSGIKTNTPAQT